MITDHYGDEYDEIENFSLDARNDFTLKELTEAIERSEEIQVNYTYPPTDHDGKGHSKTETYPDGNRPLYIGYEDREKDPIGYRLHEPEDLGYEGALLKGFGTFTSVDSGNLGDGHEAWQILKHEESGRFFRISGYYSSWDGGAMDDWSEVVPVQVNLVRFADINTPDNPDEHPVLDATGFDV